MLKKPSLNRRFTNMYVGGALSTLIRNEKWPRSHSLSPLFESRCRKWNFSSHNADILLVLLKNAHINNISGIVTSICMTKLK